MPGLSRFVLLLTPTVLLLVLAAALGHGAAAADGDDPPEPTSPWRITVEATGRMSWELTKDKTRQLKESTWQASAQVIAEVEQGAFAGPSVAVWSAHDPRNYKVVSAQGAMTYHELLAGEAGVASETKVSGGIDPDAIDVSYKYVDPLKSNELAVQIGYLEHGTITRYHQPTERLDGQNGHPFRMGANDRKAGDARQSLQVTRHGHEIVATWRYSYSEHTKGVEAQQELSVRAVFTPADTKYIAVIRPAQREVYAKWVPRGPELPAGDEARGGNELELFVEVHDRQSGKPVVVSYDATWKITGSKVPGFCMNFPRKGDANDHWDLYFDARKNRTREIRDDGETLVMKGLSGDALATVSARDYGAYGRVDVEILLRDGTALTAYYEGPDGVTAAAGIAVPQDDNGNHIADAWETDEHVPKGLVATWDEEDTPSGYYAKGDGYDLYEEYRGFYLGEPEAVAKWAAGAAEAPAPKSAFARLSPTRRDLLVDVSGTNPNVLMRGALAYGAAAETSVWLVPGRDQLDHLDGDTDDAHPRGGAFDRVEQGADFGEAQAIVWIRTDGPIVGNPQAQTAPAAPYEDQTVGTYHGKQARIPIYMSPRFTAQVGINPPAIAADLDVWIGWLDDPGPNFTRALEALKKQGIVIDHKAAAQRLRKDAKARRKVYLEVVAFTVMHELGHATGAQHHEMWQYMQEPNDDHQDEHTSSGAVSCPMRYWHASLDKRATILLLVGKWDPVKGAPDGSTWSFCSENRREMRLHETAGQLYDPGAGADGGAGAVGAAGAAGDPGLE